MKKIRQGLLRRVASWSVDWFGHPANADYYGTVYEATVAGSLMVVFKQSDALKEPWVFGVAIDDIVQFRGRAPSGWQARGAAVLWAYEQADAVERDLRRWKIGVAARS